ncbi:MAG: 4-hydroxy-3-methylbut-2-enyl diphosphate reductase, partial [Bacteroidales bacterium]
INREPKLREFAGNFDVIIFVSDSASSNGSMLYNICKEENYNTYFISRPDELDPEWFRGAESAGISGATSTPGWILRDVASRIEEIF